MNKSYRIHVTRSGNNYTGTVKLGWRTVYRAPRSWHYNAGCGIMAARQDAQAWIDGQTALHYFGATLDEHWETLRHR